MRSNFESPDFINKMSENKWLGDKTKQGFYKKSKDANGNRIIEALNLNTMEFSWLSINPKQYSFSCSKEKEIKNLNQMHPLPFIPIHIITII